MEKPGLMQGVQQKVLSIIYFCDLLCKLGRLKKKITKKNHQTNR